jgi:predicted nucleic acid-binding protein
VANEIFVDSGAWIAISDHHDKFHETATSFYRHLIDERRFLVTTNLVIAEAYIIIRRTGGLEPALRLLQSLRAGPRLQKIYSDSHLEEQAESILVKYDDQDFSYVDAVSFVLMKERGIEEAFAFDGHFITAGYQILPGK